MINKTKKKYYLTKYHFSNSCLITELSNIEEIDKNPYKFKF